MPPFGAMTRRLPCYFIFEELITKMPPKKQFGATEADFTSNSDTFFGKPCLYYCSLHHVCSMHYVLPELRPHVVFHECLFQTNQEIAIIHKRQLTPPCIRLGVKNWKKNIQDCDENQIILMWKINKRFSGPTQRSPSSIRGN